MKLKNRHQQDKLKLVDFMNKNKALLAAIVIAGTTMSCMTEFDIGSGVVVGIIGVIGFLVWYNDPSQRVNRDNKATNKASKQFANNLIAVENREIETNLDRTKQERYKNALLTDARLKALNHSLAEVTLSNSFNYKNEVKERTRILDEMEKRRSQLYKQIYN